MNHDAPLESSFAQMSPNPLSENACLLDPRRSTWHPPGYGPSPLEVSIALAIGAALVFAPAEESLTSVVSAHGVDLIGVVLRGPVLQSQKAFRRACRRLLNAF